MTESEILDILSDWNFWGNFDRELQQRPVYLSRIEQLVSRKTATVILGIRRAGKSSVVSLLIKNRLKAHTEKKNSCIINFEDPRFFTPLSSKDLFDFYEVYEKNLEPSNPLLVLDEVQNVKEWEKFVRFLIETKHVCVIVTGSSSKLLGKELSTVLTGRHVDIEIFPLSFKEILNFKGIETLNAIEITKQKIKIKRLFDEYVAWGGFPEVVLEDSIMRKRELLIRYFDDIVIKDVVKRYAIKEIEKLEHLGSILISNISTLQSFNKLKERIGVSLDTVERFAKYLETVRVFFFVKRFDYSVGKQIRSVSKIYVADPGFYNVKGFKFSENYGKIAENIVAIELFRKRSLSHDMGIYYWKDYQQREIDFVVQEGTRIKELIQVCWDIDNPETKKREIKSLLKASDLLKCDNLLIITHNVEASEKLRVSGTTRQIKYMPLWKWLLQ